MNEQLTAEDRADMVAGLFERINHLNQVIAQRRANADADPLAIEEFTTRRDKYVGKLNQMLHSSESTIEFQIPV